MFFTGIIIAVMALAIIGVFHPIVIKTEYYTGVRYWWVFMLLGLLCLAAALFVEDIIGSRFIMKPKDRTKNRGNEDKTFSRVKDKRQEHNERD